MSMSSTTTLNDDPVDDLRVKDVEESESTATLRLPKLPIEVGPTKEFGFLPIPSYLRDTPGVAIEFHLGRICLLSFCTIFLIANLGYYPTLLTHIAKTFGVSYEKVTGIPALIEAGYATGIVSISPLADLIRRRQLILVFIFASASLSIGLALTSSFLIFQILVFLTGLCTISPQIIITLARDHAHPSKSSTVYSIILAGYFSGILAARLLAGIISHSVPWRFVFYFAFAIQYAILILCYCIIPDFPPKNKDLTYRGIWSTMLKYAFTDPAVVQIELISMALGVAVANYSITLTFLLGGAPYYYPTIKTGLWGLTDLTGIVLSPFAGRLVDHITPWNGLLLSVVGLLIFQSILAASASHLPALIVACAGIDAMRQLQYISLAGATYSISIEAASRLNALLLITYYLGQLIGTSAGSDIYFKHGWRLSSVFGLAWYGSQMILVLVRGPRCKRRTWVGY